MEKEMKVPFLCGGVIFFLIMEAVYKKGPARERKKSDHSQPQVMKDLVEAITGKEAVLAAKDTTKYKQCEITGSVNIPFDRKNGGFRYDSTVRHDYRTALERMDRFVEKHINPEEAGNLAHVLGYILFKDEQISDDDEFYTSKSGKPFTRVDILGEAFCDLSAYLVGLMHYCLTVRCDDNCLGAATIQAISSDGGYRRPRFLSGILSAEYGEMVETCMPKDRETYYFDEIDDDEE